MNRKYTLGGLSASAALLASIALSAQTLLPKDILHPKADSWPTYSGDYTGRRYIEQNEINTGNVSKLQLAWSQKLVGGAESVGTPMTTVGGVGTGVATTGQVKGSVLLVEGVLYVTTPDNVWALDAKDGHPLWHYLWKTRGGTHIGNRGAAMWHDRVFFETPDDYLVALEAKTGKEIWHKEIASFDLQYFSTMAPHVIGDHLLVGTGNDLDEPGLLQSFNPQTGAVEWKWYAVPMDKDDPALKTWKNLDAASHGGGNIWVNGSYDPDTHLYIFGTANPTAAYTSQSRGPGANLYTCTLVALDVDTGKMKWYYQTSPHDTHDFDSAQTPVLVDGTWDGKPRKLVLTAARNGYFFVVDRLTGEHLSTSKLVDSPNWADAKLNPDGSPARIPAKDYDLGGSLVSPANGGVVNWPPPAYNPGTGLFYINANESFAMYYLATTDPRGAMGLGGKDELGLGSLGAYLIAMDYKTGKPAWRHRYPGVTGGGTMPGVLTTSGGLVFASDLRGNLVAYDAAKGNILWHAAANVTNAPETYLFGGHQYILVAGRDMLYAYRLP